MSPRGAARLLPLALFAALLSAADFTSLQPQGYLSDFAGVVRNPAQRQAVESYLKRVEDATGAQIALVTVPSLDGEPIEDVANLLYRKWGIGQKKSNEGVLLLLAVRDRRSRLEVGYGLEPVLPDGSAGDILRAMRPALRNNDYGAAMLAAAETLGTRIAQSKNVTIANEPLRRAPRQQHQEPFPWPAIAFGLILLLIVASKLGGRRGVRGGRRGHPGAVFFPPFMGGGWGGGGSSGGGFGNYDSGGGFGGFGGGDAGGGGASSDW
jgi:uncharacterized protein